MKIKIKENSWVAKIAARKLNSESAAIVFGRTIHLHNTKRSAFLTDTKWVCHELKHIEQYQQHGFVGFIAKYLLEWIKKGYFNNRFEAEARKAEMDNTLLQKAEFD